MNKIDKSLPIPVIGIGASAGGLEAIKKLIQKIPDDKNIAYVIIQHLDPKHKSIMDSILKKHTSLKVKVIEEGLKIKPQHIYLNPPDKIIEINNGKFQLKKLEHLNTVKLPIDHFFRSLSEELGEKSVCIILSGTGTDGTQGLKAIKRSGGMVIVQEKKEAEFKGMHNSAIETGLVDQILPVEEIPQEIIKYLQHPYVESPSKIELDRISFKKNIKRILNILRKKTGHDFSNYKSKTVCRRVERRMAINKIRKIEDYIQFLQENHGEIDNLFKDMLISVTSFFREPEAFQVLHHKVLPDLLNKLPDDRTFRVWVPGCATGEEAYSIGILLIEVMEKISKFNNCKIFASDIDEDAIKFARKGVYPENIASDVPKSRLKRFFVRSDSSYKIKKKLREMLVFAEHNIIKDPPFPNLDLICCRNLLIYLDRKLHDYLIPLFHYSLNKNGVLFLGVSESIRQNTNLFKTINKKWRIFRRQEVHMEKNITFPNYSMEDYHNFNQDNRESKNKQDINVQKLAQKIILDNFSWPSVLIDKNFEIHYFNGNTEKYLTQPKGKASLNLLNMARKNLRYKLTPSIHKAIHEKEKVITKDVMIEEKEKYYKVDIIVQPIRKGGSQINFLLVAFKEKGRQNSDETLYETSADEDQRVKALEQELKRTKESLQTTIEELETTNEELKSSNEELQATNEEYQSTNEELETSREEAQSTNEELTAVNSELKDKIQELSRANDDMKNLLNSTQIATIFLNTDLSIRRFTSPTSQIFNIIESDIGRPINHITSKINYDNIDEDAQEVLDTLEKQEKEIQTESGEWYSVKIMPYRTTDNLIDGVIITFTNVTRIKQAKEASRLATVVRDSNDAIMVLDLEGNILEWNKGATNIYGYQEEEALEINVSDIIPPEERSKFQELLNKIKSGQTVDSFETSRITKEGQILEVWLTITRLVDNNNNTYAIATTERDLTEIKEMQQSYEEKINELKEELKKCKKN